MAAALPRKIPSEFLRFAAAGSVGFALDAGLLLAFTSFLGWPPLPARLASFSIGLVSTWLLNRAFTFRSEAKTAGGMGKEFASYAAVQLTGGAINFVIYAAIVSLIGHQPWQLLLATAAGSGT